LKEAGGVIEQCNITNCRIQKSSGVVPEGFVPERVVAAAGGITEGLKPHSRTLTVGTDCAKRLKAYSGVGAAGGVGEERLGADGRVWTDLSCSASGRSPPVVVFLWAGAPKAGF
jgi:hypothetical protein